MTEPTYRIKTHHNGTASLYRSIMVQRGWFRHRDWEFVSGHANPEEAQDRMHQLICSKAVLEVRDYQANGKPHFEMW